MPKKKILRDAEAISKEYKKNPSIGNYIRLRKEFPNIEIEVAVIGGIDQLFYMESELRKYGIDAQRFAGVLDADSGAISEIALHIMQKMVDARSLSRSGATHLSRRGLAIPDKFIDWFIACSLDALSWNDDLHIPRDLIVLIRERLGGSKREYEHASRVHHLKMNAAMAAGQLIAQGVVPTYRRLGRIFDVAPSTVNRWFAPGEFDFESQRWSKMFDSKGNMLPLRLNSRLLRRK